MADELYPELARLTEQYHGARLASFASRVSAHQFVRLYELTRRYVAGGSEVLDWGCGTGHFSYFLMRQGYHVTGFGLFPCALSDVIGQQRGGRGDFRFVQGQPDEPVRLPFDDASYDAVFSLGVLEHVRETGGNELGSLREIARVLRPGGDFVCFHLPNRWSVVELGVRTFASHYSHPYRYTKQDIRRLTRSAGLRLLYHERYGVIPRNTFGRVGAVGEGVRTAAVIDTLDAVLSKAFGLVAQNHLFVATKPG